jgi:hypothetical protein
MLACCRILPPKYSDERDDHVTRGTRRPGSLPRMAVGSVHCGEVDRCCLDHGIFVGTLPGRLREMEIKAHLTFVSRVTFSEHSCDNLFSLS